MFDMQVSLPRMKQMRSISERYRKFFLTVEFLAVLYALYAFLHVWYWDGEGNAVDEICSICFQIPIH